MLYINNLHIASPDPTKISNTSILQYERKWNLLEIHLNIWAAGTLIFVSSFITEIEINIHVKEKKFNVILLNYSWGCLYLLSEVPLYYTQYSSWIRFSGRVFLLIYI